MSGYTGDPHMHPGPPGPDGQLLMKPFGQADLAKKVRQALDGAAAR
ncbi:MAG: hypothetical protein ISR50_18230 [Alphaproteobacteria bacterium]|nr:hypothetical protein [Alphaproteobacteria bacterium]